MFGQSVALSGDGSIALIGSAEGAAWAFEGQPARKLLSPSPRRARP